MTKVFAAVDTANLGDAIQLSQQMAYVGCGVKLGISFLYAHGADGVMKLKEKAPKAAFFFDLKSKAEPATVTNALNELSGLMPDYVSVDITGGYEMMQNAVTGLYRRGSNPTKIIGVPLSQDLDNLSIDFIGLKDESMTQHIIRQTKLAKSAGLDGVMCSSKNIALMHENCGPDFILMIDMTDLNCHLTPLQAMQAGADHLIIGSHITQAENPQRAAQEIIQTLDCK
jgi:orotidine-5'-phosphate decarboxylase